MKTVSIISQKGGAGKTTLAVHLATAAHIAGCVSLIIDADPQATASSWSQWRVGSDPEVIDCASPPLLGKKIAQASDLGCELTVIDTPPHSDIMAREACKAADLILIPCRPRGFDLAAIQLTGDLVKAAGKQAYVVFVAGPQRGQQIYKEASELIASLGLEVAPVMLPERAAFHRSTDAGKTAMEIEPEGKAAEEVAALWTWVQQRVNMTTRKRVSKRKAA
ncbi:MAG: ParA family partition ATPase [Caulobacteraceae bacterium]